MKGFMTLFLVCAAVAISIIIYLWGKLQKNEKKELEEKLAQTEADTAKIKRQNEKYVGEKKENEELLQEMHSGNNLDSANASIELLQKLADKGKSRNKS